VLADLRIHGPKKAKKYNEAMITSRVYRKGKVAEVDFGLDQLAKISKDRNAVFWLDLMNPTPDDLRIVADTLDLHELAVEDAFKGLQRPKLEHYDSHLFINMYHADFDGKTDVLDTDEISVFVTKRGLITIRDDETFDIKKITRRWDDSIELAGAGVAFLLWGLLDVIVDSYFEVIQKLDIEVEELEDLLFSDKRNDREIQNRSYALRKALVLLRRVAVPMREVLNPLVKRESGFLSNEMFAYFQDVYDHIMRVGDWTDSLRDLVTTLLETNLTIQGNNMNLIMKKVTSWAAIIAVPTAITGFYGQNVPYPGFGAIDGFWISTAAIIVGSVALYWAFRKRDWL